MKPIHLLFSILLLNLTGCVQTRQPGSEQIAQQQAILARQQQQQEAEARQKVQMQLEENDARIGETQRSIQQLRADIAGNPSRAEIQALENRLAAMEQMIQRMEVQRAKDREEIIAALTLQMQKVMAQQQAAQAVSAGRTHVVAGGETLSAIASAWKIPSHKIIQANNISNPNNLRVGQKLIIPGN